MTDKEKTLPEMPSFDFSDCEIKDDAQLEAELAKTGGSYFTPGKYDVEIAEAAYDGLANNDKTWCKVKLTFKGAGDREITSWVLFPTKDVKYGPKGTMFPFKTFKGFCSALGIEVKVPELKNTLKTYFAKPEGFVGKSVSITVGYQKAHAKWVSKDAEGNNQYHVVLKDGNVAIDETTKEPLVFPDHAAVANWAKENNVALDKFPQVLEYAVPATGAAYAGSNEKW